MLTPDCLDAAGEVVLGTSIRAKPNGVGVFWTSPKGYAYGKGR